MSKKPSKRKAASRLIETAPTVEAGDLLPMPAAIVAGASTEVAGIDLDPSPIDPVHAASQSDAVLAPAADTAVSAAPAAETCTTAAGGEASRPAESVVAVVDHAAAPAPSIDLTAGAEPSLAMRLRAAREARGMSAEQVARATRLPTAIVTEIEAGRYEQLGPAVYVRGYLRSYARAVGLPEVVADVAPVAAPVEPELMPAAPMSAPPQRLAMRFANPVIYGVMTIAVLVPLIYLARSHQESLPPPALTALDGSVAELTMPLPGAERSDATVLSAVPTQASASDDAMGPAEAPAPTADNVMPQADAAPAVPAPAPPAAEQGEIIAAEAAPAPARATSIADLPQPMLASIAPMGSSARGGRRVVLSLEEPSWVEIIGQDGRRIERALLPAGAVREYQVAGRADMQIGNTRGARLQVDGSDVDLVPHTRANVARLVVGGDGAR
jgi:cytoskeleton protein RodZ